MNNDLISRLRHYDEYEPLGYDAWNAADEIDRLLAIIEDLKRSRDFYADAYKRLHNYDVRREENEACAKFIEEGAQSRIGAIWTPESLADAIRARMENKD